MNDPKKPISDATYDGYPVSVLLGAFLEWLQLRKGIMYVYAKPPGDKPELNIWGVSIRHGGKKRMSVILAEEFLNKKESAVNLQLRKDPAQAEMLLEWLEKHPKYNVVYNLSPEGGYVFMKADRQVVLDDYIKEDKDDG